MPHVIQAAALRAVMRTLAGVWIASKQPGVLSRRADRLWCGGHRALSYWPPLTGKLIKCLVMSSPCSSLQVCRLLAKAAWGGALPGSPCPWLCHCTAVESLSLWPQGDLLWKHLIQEVPLPSSEPCAVWPSGDMCQEQGLSADVFADPQLWLGKRDGRESECCQHREQGHARKTVIL